MGPTGAYICQTDTPGSNAHTGTQTVSYHPKHGTNESSESERKESWLALHFCFLTHPCRRQPLKIIFISNDRGRSPFEWLFICDDPSDVRDLRVKVVVEIDTP